MRTVRNILTNPWALAGIAVYGASLMLLWPNKNFGHEDAISELLIFGFAFPILAWVTTLRAKPLTVTVRRSAAEMMVLGFCLVAITLYLIWGSALSEAFLPASWTSAPRLKFVVVFARKLIVFVAIPFLLFRFIFGYRWRDYGIQFAGLRGLGGNHLAVVLVLSGAILLFQYFLGGGAAPIRRGELSGAQLAIGLPLCFLWLFLDAGLVEEFFFRALLQTRVAVWFKSDVAGVALMALCFGLAHAPGFILRRAGLAEAIGENPSAVDAVAYAIVVLSVGGIFFGIVWARTRNLFALMAIHAATDLLPNLKQFVGTWGI